jgi:hypothetical protein
VEAVVESDRKDPKDLPEKMVRMVYLALIDGTVRF